jgi:hypothetical protein
MPTYATPHVAEAIVITSGRPSTTSNVGGARSTRRRAEVSAFLRLFFVVVHIPSQMQGVCNTFAFESVNTKTYYIQNLTLWCHRRVGS